MDKPLKILTVYYRHKPGGFCKRLQMKVEAYLQKGWQVHYIAVEPFPYSHPNLFPHILPTPMQSHDSLPFWIYFFLTAPWYIFWVALQKRIDILSSVSPLYAFLSGPARLYGRIPMLTLILSKPKFNTDCRKEFRLFMSIESLMEKFGLMWSDTLLANSGASRKEWVKQYGKSMERIRVLPNNITSPSFDKPKKRKDLLQEFSLEADRFLIATASILEPHKNLECLLNAFSAVTNLKATLFIIGEGVLKDSLKRLADTLEIGPRVVFTGWREDVRELLQGMDLFVFPSLREGMSESLLEAATCQVPCLVSSIPENEEVIRNPEQHFPPDQPQILAQKITRLMKDREYYEALLQSTLLDGDRFVFDWEGKITLEAEGLLKQHRR